MKFFILSYTSPQKCDLGLYSIKLLQHCLQKPVEGIRDRLYGFVQFCPKHVEGEYKGEAKTDMALDISFGSSGYALILSRAFKTVSHYYATAHVLCMTFTTCIGP